ncbi:MAG: M23 family metallopeptidase [Clostridiales bacterium]|nr:M23 family metallopeptidase [Clostridiales bacterium]
MPKLNKLIKNYYIEKHKLKYNRNKCEKIIINILAVALILVTVFYIKNKFIDRQIVAKEYVRALAIPERALIILKELSDKHGLDFTEVLAIYSLENNFYKDMGVTPVLTEIEQGFLLNYDTLKNKYKRVYPQYSKLFRDILSSLVYFPVPESFSGKVYEYTFANSWGAKRPYGGERAHEGTDIMDVKNIRGYIPIISMTDGVIENIGWNEYGGFRVGVRGENNTYFYYAHFDSFNEELKKGDAVSAGGLLGYMGDTGYSVNEGARGNFAVHLHVGISPDTKLFKGEFWINPYPFLKLIENNKFIFN